MSSGIRHKHMINKIISYILFYSGVTALLGTLLFLPGVISELSYKHVKASPLRPVAAISGRQQGGLYVYFYRIESKMKYTQDRKTVISKFPVELASSRSFFTEEEARLAASEKSAELSGKKFDILFNPGHIDRVSTLKDIYTGREIVVTLTLVGCLFIYSAVLLFRKKQDKLTLSA